MFVLYLCKILEEGGCFLKTISTQREDLEYQSLLNRYLDSKDPFEQQLLLKKMQNIRIKGEIRFLEHQFERIMKERCLH